MLSFVAIFSVSLACGFVVVVITLSLIYLWLRRKRERETSERCRHLMRKYGDHTSMAASFPYADAVFTRTNAPGQKFTEFVLPGRLHGDDCASEEERKKLISMSDPIQPEMLDPALYGVNSQESGSSEDARNSPHLKFSVHYNQVSCALEVEVERVHNMQLNDDEEVHCTATVMPRNQELMSQNATRQGRDLVIKQLFVFGIDENVFPDSYLMLRVFQQNAFNNVECVGVVYHNLEDVNRGKTTYWKKLSCTEPDTPQTTEQPAGQILLSIGYTPTDETLKVVLLRARNLLEVGDQGLAPDPYIRVTILHDGVIIQKKKTSTKRRSFSPTFNQSINFIVSLAALPQTEIQVFVVHDARRSEDNPVEKKQIIGSVEIGPNSGSKEQREHWRDLMSNRQSARWHHLSLSSKHAMLQHQNSIAEAEETPRESISAT